MATKTLEQFAEAHGINIYTIHTRFGRLDKRPIPVGRLKPETGGCGAFTYYESDLLPLLYAVRKRRKMCSDDFVCTDDNDKQHVKTSNVVRDFYAQKEAFRSRQLMQAAMRCYS